MTALYARAGDVFFTKSSTVLGKLIRWAETDPKEGSTWANHTGVVVEDGWIGEPPSMDVVRPEIRKAVIESMQAIVIEALWHARKGPLKLNGTAVRVFRPVVPWDADEMARFRAEAETYVGDKYGWWKLFIHLADRALFKGKKVLTTGLHVKSRAICSFLMAFACQMAQSKERAVTRLASHLDQIERGTRDASRNGATSYYVFGVAPQAADPDELLDYCIENPEEWREVTA
jgi:hypothetical protein